MCQSIWGLILTVGLLKLIISKATNLNIVSNCMIKSITEPKMSTTKPQTLNFQFIFEMLIIFTLNTSEMRVIFVVLISTIFALYPPNMSFLRELFSNLPSSGKYFKGDSDVGDIVMLVTLWWWLILDVGGRIIMLATFFVMLAIFSMY